MKNTINLPTHVPVLSILMGGGSDKDEPIINDPSGMRQCDKCRKWFEEGIIVKVIECPHCGENIDDYGCK